MGAAEEALPLSLPPPGRERTERLAGTQEHVLN